MKRSHIILILFLFSLLASCRPTKDACNKLYPPSVHDSIQIITRYIHTKDTIIIPGKRVTLYSTVNCDSLGRANMKQERVKSGDMTATASIENGVLKVDCLEDSLKKVIDVLSKEVETYKSHAETRVEEVKTSYWFDKYYCRPLSIIVTLSTIIFLVIRYALPRK